MDSKRSDAKGKAFEIRYSKVAMEASMKPRVRISVEGYDTSLPVDDINKALVDLFSSCGIIINVTIPIDPETNLVERRAFIILAADDAEEKALQLNGSDVGGWKVLVQVTPEEDEETMRYSDRVRQEFMHDERFRFGVDVRGFDTSLPDDDVKSTLINHFSSCGDITIVLMANKDRCAKIYFSQQDAEGKALKFNASEVGGWKLAVRPVATVVNSPRYWSGPFATVVNSPRSTVVNSVDPKFGHCVPEHFYVLREEMNKKIMAFKKRRGLA